MVKVASMTSPDGPRLGRTGPLPPAGRRSVRPDEVSWPVAGLARRLGGALELATVVVEDFGDAGYDDLERPALSFGPEKVIAEAAMLAHTAYGASPQTDLRVQELVGRLAPRARSTAALGDMALRPEMVVKRAVPHVLLTGLGSQDAEFDDFAADRCATILGHAADEPATVLAERRWLCSLWPRLPQVAPVPLRGSTLERALDLRSESREDAYGLTHMLFYVTDFGRRPPDGDLVREPRAVLADVEGLLARYLDHGDYDLVGELLMAWPELGVPWSPAAAFAFRLLGAVEDEVGLLPCGNVDPVRLSRLTGSERTRYARAMSYHTALVMGFLCAATLRARLPGSVGTAAPEGWRRFRELIDPDDTSHWLAAFDASPPVTKASLAPLVRDLVLTQAMRQHDLARAGEALAVAARLGMPSSAMTRAVSDRLWALDRASRIAGRGPRAPIGARRSI